MNITCSPINTAKEIVLRILYLVPIPFCLLACFLPMVACIYHDWTYFFGGVLSICTALYWRHVGVTYWEFLRLDDEIDKMSRLPSYEIALRRADECDLDRVLMEIQRHELTQEPSHYLETHSSNRHQHHGHNPWEN